MSIHKEKIAFFEKHLVDFFQKAGREHLPWRKKRMNAYEVWVSEIMLQQTQVSRVTLYYVRFLERFPTVEVLAQASWEDFLPYYEGLGYYARGRNMLKAAQSIVSEYGGTFPRDKRLLETLPGIGPYTAAAIMSFAYGDEHLAWDTNLKRVIGRFFFGGKQLVENESFWENTFQTPKKVLNAALMDFGSALCVARPKCEACSLSAHCVYYREKGKGEQSTISKKQVAGSKKQKTAWGDAQVYLFLHENHKKYYSPYKTKFSPFIIPATHNTRAGIKKYFQEKYALSLSVRPPHKKVLIRGMPTLLVNAQVLLGSPLFNVFFKKDQEQYNESLGNGK